MSADNWIRSSIFRFLTISVFTTVLFFVFLLFVGSDKSTPHMRQWLLAGMTIFFLVNGCACYLAGRLQGV